MKKLLGRISFTVYVAVVIIVSVYLVCPSKPLRITLGTLANPQVDLSGQRAIIANCITGKRVGRYIVFDPPDDLRRCVIFSLADVEVKPTVTTFEALIVGVMDERIPGCDHDPPFVYVIQARPVME